MANLIRLKQIESSSALIGAAATGNDFSQSVTNVVVGRVAGILSGSTISNITLLNATVTTANSDKYSLIISGAAAIVNANNLPDGGFNDVDTNVPGQLWLNGTTLPTDPSISGSGMANVIDQGEW
jgi:hypothetical protein